MALAIIDVSFRVYVRKTLRKRYARKKTSQGFDVNQVSESVL